MKIKNKPHKIRKDYYLLLVIFLALGIPIMGFLNVSGLKTGIFINFLIGVGIYFIAIIILKIIKITRR